MSKYKNKLNKQVNKANQKGGGAIDVFFDVSKSLEIRLEAFEKAGTFEEEGHIKSALQLMRDADQQDELRAAALLGIVHEISNQENLINETIAFIADGEAPSQLRRAALTIMQTLHFSSPIYPAHQPSYFNALREVIDHNDAPLRATAMEQLSLVSDEYIQRRLLEGLEDPTKQIAEPEVAIQLLSYDLHADHFPVLRKIAENPPNLRSKKEALRNLAADSDSTGLLMKTLQDKEEDSEIRHLCAVALQTHAPEEMESYAKEIILHKEEDDELKAAMLNTLMHSAKPAKLDNAARSVGSLDFLESLDFLGELDKIHEDSQSPNLKKMVNQYKNNIAQRQNK